MLRFIKQLLTIGVLQFLGELELVLLIPVSYLLLLNQVVLLYPIHIVPLAAQIELALAVLTQLVGQ